jgi:hypothetical protein
LLKKAAKQLEECAEEIVNLKIRCENQEKELEKNKSHLNRTEMVTGTQLAEKDEQINKLQSEVGVLLLNKPDICYRS